MPQGAHQWLVNPQAIEVWPHTTPALCSEPKCYLAAKYQVAFPRQAPVLFCSRHSKSDGGVAWPSSSLPQQATEPSRCTPQVWSRPALTQANSPAGGVAWPLMS